MDRAMLMKKAHVIALSGMMFVLCTQSQAFAQPPKIESGSSTVFSKLNPANWSLPKLPKVKKPEFKFLQASNRSKANQKSGFWSGVKRTTRKAWNSTTNLLDPYPETKKKSGPGLFSTLFSPPPEPRNVTTVGDFLAQPSPQ